MKRLIAILILAAMLMSSCGEVSAAKPPLVGVDESGNIETVDRSVLPDNSQPASDEWSESRYYPLVKASSGAYCNGFLYFIDDSGYYIKSTDFATGKTDLCCKDPLCDHGKTEKGGINMASDCTALASGSRIIAREEKGHTVLYYDARVGLDCELRRFDINENKVSVLAELESYLLTDFYFYGDDLLLSLAGLGENMKTGIYRLDKEPTLLIEGFPALIGSDERGIVWRMGSGVYITSSDFSATVALMSDFNGMAEYYHDGYIYYYAQNDCVTLQYEPYTGEFEEKYSSGNSGTAYIPRFEWYRIRTKEGAQAELICDNASMSQTTEFFLDHENGVLYYLPLSPVDRGCVLWKDTSMTPDAAAQMGFSGKPIMKRKIMHSGGCVFALDLVTLEAREVYSGLDGDVTEIYGFIGGSLAVKYEIKDTAKVQALIESDPPSDSALVYSAYTLLPLK